MLVSMVVCESQLRARTADLRDKNSKGKVKKAKPQCKNKFLDFASPKNDKGHSDYRQRTGTLDIL